MNANKLSLELVLKTRIIFRIPHAWLAYSGADKRLQNGTIFHRLSHLKLDKIDMVVVFLKLLSTKLCVTQTLVTHIHIFNQFLSKIFL